MLYKIIFFNLLSFDSSLHWSRRFLLFVTTLYHLSKSFDCHLLLTKCVCVVDKSANENNVIQLLSQSSTLGLTLAVMSILCSDIAT